MSAKQELITLLNTPLPSKRVQRRANFRPSKEQKDVVFKVLNSALFDGKLSKPVILMRTMRYWGLCTVYDDPKLWSKIKISNQCFCLQWFTLILAHEMVHQYQWEIDGPEIAKNKGEVFIDHNETFFKFKDRFADHGLLLAEEYSREKWLKHQDLLNL